MLHSDCVASQFILTHFDDDQLSKPIWLSQLDNSTRQFNFIHSTIALFNAVIQMIQTLLFDNTVKHFIKTIQLKISK